MRARSNSPTALSLLETLLALSMLSLILLALHTALASGTRAYRRCRQRSDRDTMAWGAIRLIADDLQRLALPAPGQAHPTLWGAPQVQGPGSCMLRLRTNARPAPGAREMLVDYFFMPAGEGGSLVRRSQPLAGPGAGPVGQGDDTGRYEIIAADLLAVRLRYFDGRSWSDRWDAAGGLPPPRLVEVSLDVAAPGAPAETYTQALPVVVEAALIPAGAEAGT